MDLRDNLIQFFFSIGMTHADIASSLAVCGFIISTRHLRRILKKLNLYRRRDYSDVNSVIDYIRNEINSSGSLHGYRWMYTKCMNAGYHVRKEDVRVIIACLDPTGTAFR